MLLTTHYLEEADALADRIVMIGRGRVIAEGTPAEIKARVVGRKIRCRTALPLAEIAALPGVRDVRRQDELTEVFAAEAERTVFELLSRDPSLSALEVRGADLEEAFLTLTQVRRFRGGGRMIAQTIAQTPSRNLLRIYALEARYEFLKQLRMPAYVVPSLAFPLVFYFMFGVALPHGSGGPFDIPTYMLATYGAFGVMNVSLFGFGVGVAIERGQGWMLFKRASPMPPLAYFAGQARHHPGVQPDHGERAVRCSAPRPAVCACRLGPGSPCWGCWSLGTLPFAAFGLAVAYWAGPNSAVAVLNIISLPSAFGSGMWIPIQMLPRVIKKVALFLPPYHYAQLALQTLGLDRGEAVAGPTVFALAVVHGGLSLSLAWIGFRRDEGKTFG